MELADVLRLRHMVRSFSGSPVPPSAIDAIVRAARSSPRAGNTDGCDLVVLVGPDETGPFWEATTTSDWRERSPRWPGLSRAPVVICVFVNPRAYLERYDEPDKARSGLGTEELGGGGEPAWAVPFWFVDAGFAAYAMLLSACDSGLAACFLGNFRGEAEIRERLGAPGGHRYLGAVLVGEPDGGDWESSSASRRRRDPDELVHRGRW